MTAPIFLSSLPSPTGMVFLSCKKVGSKRLHLALTAHALAFIQKRVAVEEPYPTGWLFIAWLALTGTHTEQEKQESEKTGGTERPGLLRGYRSLSVFAAPFQFLSYTTAGKIRRSKTW